MRVSRILHLLFYIFTIGLMLCPPPVTASEDAFLDLDLADLMQIQITSAGRKEQSLSDVPAAVYVIDAERIANSSATSVPELLRMVPGIQVARIGSSKWAITARGFNGQFSSELLVQIDGRSVYTPSYSGVYWDSQNLMLEEIERIEVIRGPGATLWGANAVNGVINIITKPASKATGVYASAGTGTYEQAFASMRYGQQLGSDSYAKGYLNINKRASYDYFNNDTSLAYLYENEEDANDDWSALSGGFRLDGDIGLNNSWTLQGDLYSNRENQDVSPYWYPDAAFPTNLSPTLEDDRIDAHGHNLLARWQHSSSETNSWSLQGYYDYSDRDEIYLSQSYKTFDLDFQHRFQPLTIMDIVWGGGYRYYIDEFEGCDFIDVDPSSDTFNLFSFFIQDEIELRPKSLSLTLGSKFEHNEYTGFEVQPSVRLLWRPASNHSLWTSVSRAVRTPSRYEEDVFIYTFPSIDPMTGYPTGGFNTMSGSDMDAETVIAYEAGYRYSHNSFSADLALFYNDYKKLREWDFSDETAGIINNGVEGSSLGLEINLRWQPLKRLTTELSYSYIDFDMTSSILSADNYSSNAQVLNGSSPTHQLSLMAEYELLNNLKLNLLARYVDELEICSPTADGIVVDAYFALDANIIWKISDKLELKLAGQNLTDPQHLEFISEYFNAPTEIDRSLYAQLSYRY